MLLCMNKDHLLLVSGTGEVIEPDEPVLAIGSGGAYATAAARAPHEIYRHGCSSITREAFEDSGVYMHIH